MTHLTEATLKQDSNQYNDGTRRHHLENEIRNSFYNHNVLTTRLRAGTAADLACAPVVTNTPAILTGSGPSLDWLWPVLKDWEGGIIASPSQASSLCYHGKDPDYIVALDPDEYEAELAVDKWEGRKTALVTHPGMRNTLINYWKNQLYLFTKMEPATPFYSGSQATGYSVKRMTGPNTYEVDLLVPTRVVMFSCSLAAQLCVAQRLGYSPLFLCGADFGAPLDQGRFTATKWVNGEWKRDEINWSRGMVENQASSVRGLNGVPTNAVQVFYKKNFLTSVRLTKAKVIDCSAGIITELPKADLKDVVAKQGKGFKALSPAGVILATERYMAMKDTYCLEYKGGLRFIESANPDKELPYFLASVLGAYIKDYLQSVGNPEEITPEIMADIQVGIEEMNINANMQRIKKLRADKFADVKQTWLPEIPDMMATALVKDGKWKGVFNMRVVEKRTGTKAPARVFEIRTDAANPAMMAMKQAEAKGGVGGE